MAIALLKLQMGFLRIFLSFFAFLLVFGQIKDVIAFNILAAVSKSLGD